MHGILILYYEGSFSHTPIPYLPEQRETDEEIVRITDDDEERITD